MRIRWCAFFVVAPVALAAAAPRRQAALPWYMQETAMTADGRLTFLEKPWWPRARALAEGQSFTLDLNGDGRPDTMVYRKDGNLIEAIDDSGKAADILNQVNTCYVVSFKGTGLVDRMVSWIDNDGNGKYDEMDFRHYRDGYLRYAWFAENYDNDGVPIFEMKNWTYVGGNSKLNRFRGNLMIYINKYDSATKSWLPMSECPFSFWDVNHDGRGEMVLRVSATPIDANTRADNNSANNYNYMWAPTAPPLAQTGNTNVRFSYNVDPEPRREPPTQPHYNFGFTMTGAQRYAYPGMAYTNPRRRPPQTVLRIAWKDGVRVALDYPADHTGFTWDEARSVWRWEGQFWIYERRILTNTGGPTQRWNMRREYSARPEKRRQIYYSGVDQRYHLFGASEGWMEVGHLVNDRKDLEFRWYDSDGDGYLDTWEVLAGDNPVPVRVSHVDPRARLVPLTREFLMEDYNKKVLPRAIEEDQRLIAALKRVAASPLAQAYEDEAAKSEMLERRRYCLDIARELYFLQVREKLYTDDANEPYPRLGPTPKWYARMTERGPVDGGYTQKDSVIYWDLAQQIRQFEQQYASGRFDEARQTLERFGK